MPELFLPPNPADRFIRIYEAIDAERKRRKISEKKDALRFSALAAITCRGEPKDVAETCRRIGNEIRKESGWLSCLACSHRFIVSALLLLNGDTAEGFLQELKRVNKIFRKYKIRKGQIYETMAILVLRLYYELKPIPDSAVIRFKEIYEEMKRYHWWLTGPDDYVACATLVSREESVKSIGQRIENIYQALSKEGFSKGDPLQTTANILYMLDGEPEAVAHRFAELAKEFKTNGVSIWQVDYDELAILSFLDHPPSRIVEFTLKNREPMDQLFPKPDRFLVMNDRFLTFNLAASLTFFELIQVDKDLKIITDAKALMNIQAIVETQQTAASARATIKVANTEGGDSID